MKSIEASDLGLKLGEEWQKQFLLNALLKEDTALTLADQEYRGALISVIIRRTIVGKLRQVISILGGEQ